MSSDQQTFKRVKQLYVYARRLLKLYFRNFRATANTFVVVVAIAIGLLGGLGAVGIQHAIEFFQRIFWGDWNLTIAYFESLPWWYKILIPSVGSFIVGLIIHFVAKEAKGHGVPEVMEAIALRNGIIRPRVVLAKLMSSALYIGAGGSVGREGPVIQIGSSIGSTLGQLLRVNSQRMKTFVACGAAAGIAAAFNAPVAGALFSIEVILGDFGVSQFSPIVVSSVVATVVSRHFLGDFPAFPVPLYKLVSPVELVFYAGLGLLAGFVALFFINTLHRFETTFDKFKGPIYVKTLIGGLMIGVMGAFIPHIFGVGYFSIDAALKGELLWQWLLLLVLAKTFATSISLGSGGSGGVFAPSLFLGAMTGGFFGEFVHQFFPETTAGSGAYALVGMAAVVAGATHAPITAILIIFELTNDYKIILPLMISSIIATLLSTKLKKESIYTIKLIHRGIDIFAGREMNVLHSIRVREVMKARTGSFPADTPLHEIIKKVFQSPQSQFFVCDHTGKVEGIISPVMIREVLRNSEGLSDLLVAHDLMDTDFPRVTDDDTVDYAMKLFGQYDIELLPVIDRPGSDKLIGQMSRQDVLEAYNHEIAKRDVTTEFAHYVKFLEKTKSLEFVEGYIIAQVPCPASFVGKTLRELNLRARYQVQVVLIKRATERDDEKGIVPGPSDTFRVDDALILVGPEKKVEAVKHL